MDLTGTWRNQNGSVLKIGSLTDGRFDGSFVSTKGRAAQGTAYAVHGSVNDEVLAFFVDFRTDDSNLHSIVNFSGRVVDENEFHTLWVLTRQFEDSERTKATQPWNAFILNSDVFKREP